MNWLRPVLGSLTVIGGCALVSQPPTPPAPPAPAAAPSATGEAAPSSGTPASMDPTPPATTHPATTRATPAAALPALAATQQAAVKHSAAPATGNTKPPAAAESRKPPPAAPATASTAPPGAAAAPRAPAPSAPPLDLMSLQQRLRATPAIGVFTKLSLKNQVDDLLAQFKGYFAGTVKLTLADLRQRYEQLLLKVLTLLQDGDPNLASEVKSSKEAIWGVLTDKNKLESL